MDRDTELLLHNLKRVFKRLGDLSDEHLVMAIEDAKKNDELPEVMELMEGIDQMCDEIEHGII